MEQAQQVKLENTNFYEINDYRSFISNKIDNKHINTSTIDFYLNYFINQAKNREYFCWNKWAFLFGATWCYYRKLYLWGTIFIIINLFIGFATALVLSLIHAYVHMSKTFFQFTVFFSTFILSNGFLGSYGSYIYFKKFNKLIKSAPNDQKQREEYLSKNGGVSLLSFLLLNLIFIIINIFLRNY